MLIVLQFAHNVNMKEMNFTLNRLEWFVRRNARQMLRTVPAPSVAKTFCFSFLNSGYIAITI